MRTFSDMQPVLTASQMREADRITIEKIGIPGFTLMESAGREIAQVAEEMLEIESFENRIETQTNGLAHIIILCGKGNNGGDGFVAARYLAAEHRVSVVMMSSGADLTGDAAAHFNVLKRTLEPATSQEDSPTPTIPQPTCQIVEFESLQTVQDLPSVDLIIDALLGTGLNSEVRWPYADLIHWVNGQSSPVLSVDIPSGLSADSGSVLGVVVRAHVTVTLAALKMGLVLDDGPECVGALHVADIGIPNKTLLDAASHTPCFFSSDLAVGRQLPGLSRHDHKYTSGPTLIVGGSVAFPGAPVLSSLGAARAGSKYVVCIGPRKIQPLLSEKLTEIPVESWEEEANEDHLEALIKRLGARWTKAKAILIGPGLGRSPEIKTLVKYLLALFPGPAVIDADALFALQDEKDWVRTHSNGKWIFTPHEGEFARLLGSVNQNSGQKHPQGRLAMARDLASEWNVIVLLKGLPCITVLPSGEAVINSTGNAAAGTAGSGDVLAGIIAGLLGQGLEPGAACCCGIHLAGTAADLYVEEQSARSMMAGDVLTYLPHALADLSE